MRNKNFLWVLIITVVLLVSIASGVVYWSFFKAKKIADSAVTTAKKSESLLTPTPSPEISATPMQDLPSTDVPGEDVSGVERYPNSIRTEFDKNDDSSVINVSYFSADGASKILEYFKDSLVKNGWILRAFDESSLNFSNNEADLSIELITDKSGTQYQIHYIKVEPQAEE